jgi:hypothetical protein
MVAQSLIFGQREILLGSRFGYQSGGVVGGGLR